MKQTMTKEGPEKRQLGSSFAGACRACGQRILTQINRAKEVILAESSETLATNRHVVQLALNEAEALAWQTTHPHLVFPSLALEKVQAVANWNDHQQRVWRENSNLAWAV